MPINVWTWSRADRASARRLAHCTFIYFWRWPACTLSLLLEAMPPLPRVRHWTPCPWGAALRQSSKDTPATPPLRSLPAGEFKRFCGCVRLSCTQNLTRRSCWRIVVFHKNIKRLWAKATADTWQLKHLKWSATRNIATTLTAWLYYCLWQQSESRWWRQRVICIWVHSASICILICICQHTISAAHQHIQIKISSFSPSVLRQPGVSKHIRNIKAGLGPFSK